MIPVRTKPPFAFEFVKKKLIFYENKNYVCIFLKFKMSHIGMFITDFHLNMAMSINLPRSVVVPVVVYWVEVEFELHC